MLELCNQQVLNGEQYLITLSVLMLFFECWDGSIVSNQRISINLSWFFYFIYLYEGCG